MTRNKIINALHKNPSQRLGLDTASALLKQEYGFESNIANYLTSIIYIGMCFAPVLSRIAEKTGRYLETITGAGIVMLAVFVMLVAGILEYKSITILFFIVGICCAYQILAIYKASILIY